MEKRLKYFNELQIMRNGMEKVITTNGSLQLSCKNLRVGQKCTIKIKYIVGSDIIYPGGVIRFTIPFGFTKPQVKMPLFEGYTTVHSNKKGVTLKTEIIEGEWWNRGPDRKKIENVSEHVGTHVWVRVEGNPLLKGDTIVLTYGDCSYSKFGVAKACLTTGHAQFDVATDSNGRMEAPYSGFYLSNSSPTIYINPMETEGYEIILPSEVQKGDEYKVHIIAHDNYYNLNYNHVGDIRVKIGEEIKTVSFSESDCGIKTFYLKANDEDKIIALILDNQGRVLSESNTCVVKSGKINDKIYWGDLHGHSGIQWGRGSGRSYYEYAQEVAALDFCALTDPDAGRYTNNNETAMNSLSCYMTDKQWEEIQEVNKQFYKEGEFVTILGYEYHNDAPDPEFGGDRNVYFDNHNQKILRCVDEGSYTPSQLWETMKRNRINGLTIPHHTAKKVMLGTWDLNDDEIQRLVEIYSCWGSSEGENCERPIIGGAIYENHSVQYALNKGYKLGFVGGSDTHCGNPGYARWVFSNHELSYRGGLTCVKAKELNLESIIQALKERKVYATTGERIILDFKINDYYMGSELLYSENINRKLYIEAEGTTDIERVDIISMGNVIYTKEGNGRAIKFTWEDDSYLVDGWTYYYVRVLQKDKGIAWSSPIWIQ